MSPDLAIRFLAALLIDALPVVAVMAVASIGVAALLRRAMPGEPRSLITATAFGLVVAWLVTAGHLLGLAGWLNATSASLLLVLPSLGLLGLIGQRLPTTKAWKPSASHGIWLLPTASLFVTLVAASLPPGMLWGGEPNAYDVLSYHLQIPREWHDGGQIIPLEHNVFSRMPLGNEVLFLIAMHLRGGPADATLAVHFVNVTLSIGSTLACFAAVRATGGSRQTAAIAATLFACTPWVMMLSSIAYNEPLYLLATSLTAAWLLRAVNAGSVRGAFLAGLFAGLGFTAKYTALPMLIVPAGAALVEGLVLTPKRKLRVVDQRDIAPDLNPKLPLRRPWLVCVLAFVAASLLLPLPWLVRNTVWHGFPTSPVVGGVDDWSNEQVDRFARAHDATITSAPSALWSEVLANGRFGYTLLPLGIVGLALLASRGLTARGSNGESGDVASSGNRRAVSPRLGEWSNAVVLLTLTLFAISVWATATHLIGRFLVVLIPTLTIAAALGLGRWPKLATPLAALAAIIGLVHVVALHDADNDRIGCGLIGLLGDGRSTLVGVTGQPTFQTPFDNDPGRPVYLVGDAMAFAYPVDDLHYRVVFDVPPADDPWRAWLGDALDTAPDDAIIVVNPSEVARLARTYGTPTFATEPPARLLTMGELRQHLASDAESPSQPRLP